MIKAVGAASEEGKTLEELEAIGNRVAEVTRTMGMALFYRLHSSWKVGSPIFTLDDDGNGYRIHGEPEAASASKLSSANKIVDELFEAVADDLPYVAGDEVALMINGMGGTPSQSFICYMPTRTKLLKTRFKDQARNYVGEYCTSLEMAGFSRPW